MSSEVPSWQVTKFLVKYGLVRADDAEQLWKHACEVDFADPFRRTALHKAASRSDGYGDVVELLRLRANALSRDNRKQQALFKACDPRVAELLIRQRCQVRWKDSFGRTPLFVAAGSGLPSGPRMVCALKELGGHLGDLDSSGESCLFAAARIKEPQLAKEMCSLLLEEFDLEAQLVSSSGALAGDCASTDAVAALLPRSLKRARDAGDSKERVGRPKIPKRTKPPQDAAEAEQAPPVGPGTLLFYACACGDAKRAGELLEAEADISWSDKDGATALHAAASTSNACTEALLKYRARTDATDLRGQTPLFQASSPSIAEALLRRHADVEHRDELGRTSLFSAVQHGFLDVVNALKEMKGDVLCKDNSGETCLFEAARLRKASEALDMCKLLLKHMTEQALPCAGYPVQPPPASILNAQEQSASDVATTSAARKLLRSYEGKVEATLPPLSVLRVPDSFTSSGSEFGDMAEQPKTAAGETAEPREAEGEPKKPEERSEEQQHASFSLHWKTRPRAGPPRNHLAEAQLKLLKSSGFHFPKKNVRPSLKRLLPRRPASPEGDPPAAAEEADAELPSTRQPSPEKSTSSAPAKQELTPRRRLRLETRKETAKASASAPGGQEPADGTVAQAPASEASAARPSPRLRPAADAAKSSKPSSQTPKKRTFKLDADPAKARLQLALRKAMREAAEAEEEAKKIRQSSTSTTAEKALATRKATKKRQILDQTRQALGLVKEFFVGFPGISREERESAASSITERRPAKKKTETVD